MEVESGKLNYMNSNLVKKYDTWIMVLQVPNSRSKKAIILHEKYNRQLRNKVYDIYGKHIFSEYVIQLADYFVALRDYYSISNLKGSDYFILANEIKYSKFADGHHCYFIKYENHEINKFNCYKFTYGRISFGCSRVPIFEAIESFANDYAIRFLHERHELFWFQMGFEKNDFWYIDKEILEKIVYEKSKELNSCPLFKKDELINIIRKLPEKLNMCNNPFFEFIPTSNYRKEDKYLLAINNLTIDRTYNRTITHFVKRILPKPKIGFSIITGVGASGYNGFEFNGKYFDRNNFNIFDFIRY